MSDRMKALIEAMIDYREWIIGSNTLTLLSAMTGFPLEVEKVKASMNAALEAKDRVMKLSSNVTYAEMCHALEAAGLARRVDPSEVA